MEPSFWLERWREGRIGFHEGRPNAYLERHAAQLDGARRVLVPLCGKTEDLAYLASRGHQVVGIELAEDAARAFFAEHGATPQITTRGPFKEYAAGGISILSGDLFAATRELIGPVDALYDRAAMVALPPAMRAAYAKHLRALLSPGSHGLVVSFEYPQERFPGPPFAVFEKELRDLYQGLSVTLLSEGPGDVPPMGAIGLTPVERCFSVVF